MFNRVLRSGCHIEEHCVESVLKPEMFFEAVNEIKKHLVPENIIVYRYMNKDIEKRMLEWSNQKRLKKNAVIFDRAFLSTTLTPESVKSRAYVSEAYRILKIYVPKNSPCVYLELIAHMRENEVLFLPMTKLKILSDPLFSRTIECIVEI